MQRRVVVVGGNAAGLTAASRAKRLRPELEITVIESSPFISYSICGLPYFIGGEVRDFQQLLRFTPELLREKRGIEAKTNVRGVAILPAKRTLRCQTVNGNDSFDLSYDQLVLATGYIPIQPNIEGCDLAGVWTVSRLEHGLQIREQVEGLQLRRAVIIGGGYIGLMMAHGLRTLGLDVTLFESERHVFSSVDEDMAELIEAELQRQGVKLMLKTRVEQLVGKAGIFKGVRLGREIYAADLALLDVGVLPNARLALDSGLPCGLSRAIEVDTTGQTGWHGVFAAGNCAETRHLVSGRPLFSALGTTAARQGRVVGDNLAGKKSHFPGTLESSIEKVFDLSIGRTGLTTRQAIESGFVTDSVRVTARNRADYFPGSAPLDVKLIFEKPGGRLLGGQIIGPGQAGKRIDTLATALAARLSLQDLIQLDLVYAPPFATLWDPIQTAAKVGLRKL